MTKDQKIIRAKVGLLELPKQLGNVSHACKMMGYSRDSFVSDAPRHLSRSRLMRVWRSAVGRRAGDHCGLS